MGRALTLLLGIALLATGFTFASPPALAASVIVPINITVAEAGAPAFTWTIGGSCGPSPSSGLTGGTVMVTMTDSCSYTINVPADGATQRDRLTSGATYVISLAESSCVSGTCATVSNTAHVQEFLTISGSCNGAAVSVVSPTGNRWYNYGTSLIVTCNGVWGRSLGTGTRATSWNWDGGSNTVVGTTSTFTAPQTMNSGHTLNVNTVTQFQLILDAKATRALATVTNPTITSDKYWYDTGTPVTYKGYGVFDRVSGAGNRSTSWYLDSGVPAALTTTGNFTIPAMMTSSHTIHVTTATQYRVTLNSGATTMLSSITPPTVTNDKYWYDAGTQVSLVLKGVDQRAGGSGVRLSSYSLNGGPPVLVATSGTVQVLSSFPMNQMEAVAGTIVVQYQLTLDSRATIALSTLTSPPIQGDGYWYDSGTQVTCSMNGVYARFSGTGSRITGWWWDAGAVTPVATTGTFPAGITMGAPHTLHTTAVIQFQVALVGMYSVSSATQPAVSGDNYWYDTGAVVSMSLNGVFGRTSGSGERMTSYSVNNGASVSTGTTGSVAVLNGLTVTSSQTITVGSVAQYQLAMDPVTLEALSSVTAPTLGGDNYWYDAGSGVSVLAKGTWDRSSTIGYRLSSFAVNGAQPVTVASSGAVSLLDTNSLSSQQSIVSTRDVQYLLAVSGGGGATYSVSPPIAGDTGWYDSGTNLKVMTDGTYNSADGIRQRIVSWSIDGGASVFTGVTSTVTTSSIVMYAPHAVSFASATQYDVLILVKDSTGADALTPGSIQLSVNGGGQSLTGGEVWVDSGSTLSITGIRWHGVDVAPISPTQYVVSSPQTVTVNARVFDLAITVRDSLGLAVGGADATITLANGTMVHMISSGDGSVILRMIPGGSYLATIANLGLSSSVSGDASVQSSVGVSVFLSYPVVVVIIGIIVLIAVAVILIRRR